MTRERRRIFSGTIHSLSHHDEHHSRIESASCIQAAAGITHNGLKATVDTMGCTLSSDKSAAARSRRIDNELKVDRQRMSREVKLLLLGKILI